jgi:hypothetical protein
VAQLVRQEAPGLPVVFAEDETALLDLLAVEREATLVDVSRLRNQIHALLSQVDPEYETRMPKLTSKAGLQALKGYAPRGLSAVHGRRRSRLGG